ncbi:MAG: hypothetical protein ACREHD_34735 [Pirellulales bacterium]
MDNQSRAANQAAYRRLRDQIRGEFPPGRFVVVAGGRIVADASTFKELDAALTRMGFASPDVLVVEAGVEYPEKATIFFMVTGESMQTMASDSVRSAPLP